MKDKFELLTIHKTALEVVKAIKGNLDRHIQACGGSFDSFKVIHIPIDPNRGPTASLRGVY